MVSNCGSASSSARTVIGLPIRALLAEGADAPLLLDGGSEASCVMRQRAQRLHLHFPFPFLQKKDLA